jgi:sugar-specific transcriptional regulator TrmB
MQSTSLSKLQDSQLFNHSVLGGVGFEEVEVLVSLGLTRRQARVYLALLKAGDAKVKAIAGSSSVHRREVYRLLDDLSQLGLIQRNISTPMTFTPTPIAEGIKLLLKQRSSELNMLSQKAKQLTKKLSQNSSSALSIIDLKPCFGTVFEADRGRKYLKTIQEAQSSIAVVTSWRRFKQLSIHFETHLQNLLKKDVTIQIVTEKPPNHHLPKWVNTALSNNYNFKLKTQPNLPEAAVAIFDQNAAAIAFKPNTSLTKGPDLWTTNPALTVLCQAYFNNTWMQTKNCRPKPPKKRHVFLKTKRCHS